MNAVGDGALLKLPDAAPRTSGRTRKSAKYDIVDMAGRSELGGTVKNGNKTIDVSSLAAGTYIIKMYSEDHDDGQTLFVKD